MIDPATLIPDPVDVAAAAVARRPGRPSRVTADISRLVLLAALCAVGPSARSVDAGELPWQGLGSPTECDEPDHVGDGVVVRFAVRDERVSRLAFALQTLDSAVLAVTVD